MIDGYDFFYGNKNVELGFKVTITPQLVEYLENCGCLDEDEVDENIYDETDSDYYNGMAQPVYDAIIDYYLDRAESTAKPMMKSLSTCHQMSTESLKLQSATQYGMESVDSH